jgi:hypothetical protein
MNPKLFGALAVDRKPQDGNGRAVIGEQATNRPPDSTGSAGDDGDPVAER